MKGIQRAFERDRNLLTVQVLNLVEKMVMLGFYQVESELLRILEPMIALLDGSNDFHSRAEEDAFNQAAQQRGKPGAQADKSRKKSAEVFQRDKSVRYAKSEDNILMI